MNTAGFDFVAIINERFLNKALAASFYSSVFPVKFDGKKSLLGSAQPLSRLTEFDFSVRLMEPPIVDTFKEGNVLLGSSLEVEVKAITGLSMKLDMDIEIEADPVYDVEKGLLRFKLLAVEITNMNLNEVYDVPDLLLNQINDILKGLITEGFINQVDEIRLAPVLSSLTLPGISEGTILSISSGKADVLNDEAVMLAIDLKNTALGNYSEIVDFSEGNDFALGITERALHRIFDDWWESTLAPKEGKSTGSTEIKPIQELFDALTEVVIEFPSKLLSIGFLNLYIEIERVWLEYESTARYGKPSFNFVQGGKAEIIDAPINLDIDARVKVDVRLDAYLDKSSFIPNKWTHWKDKDLSHRRKTYTISKFKVDDMEVIVEKAMGSISLDEENRVVIKIDDIDMNVELDWSLPKFVLGWLTDDLKRMIRENFPDLYLFPATISTKVPDIDLTVDADVDVVETLPDEILIAGSLGFTEIPKKISPIPMFIADKSSMRVHRTMCKLVEVIKEQNKVGYYTLIDALNDGYIDCKECLKECKSAKPVPGSVVIKPS
jgi:hypothetical protein